MNWEALGAIAELIAAIGVIFSILYLALQIRQATVASRAASYQDTTALISLGNIHIFGNADAASLLSRAAATTDELTPADQIRWQAYCSYMFRHWSNIHYQHSMGTLDEIRYRSLLGPMFINLRSVRFRNTWRRFRPGFDGPFGELVDRVVERYDREGVTLDRLAVGPDSTE